MPPSTRSTSTCEPPTSTGCIKCTLVSCGACWRSAALSCAWPGSRRCIFQLVGPLDHIGANRLRLLLADAILERGHAGALQRAEHHDRIEGLRAVQGG